MEEKKVYTYLVNDLTSISERTCYGFHNVKEYGKPIQEAILATSTSLPSDCNNYALVAGHSKESWNSTLENFKHYIEPYLKPKNEYGNTDKTPQAAVTRINSLNEDY